MAIAGFLHDMIEDTDCTLKDIEARFSKRVTELVDALTSEVSTKSYRERTLESLDKVLKIGQDAVAIRLVDAPEY